MLNTEQAGVLSAAARSIAVVVQARLKCALEIVLAADVVSIGSVCLRDGVAKTALAVVEETLQEHLLCARVGCAALLPAPTTPVTPQGLAPVSAAEYEPQEGTYYLISTASSLAVA